MLSIRRRQGPYEFRKETFGGPDQGWPNWGELGPILLRSAGIVGIAAVIMVIAAGDTLFRGPVRGPQVQSAAAMAPKAETGSADLVAAPVAEAEPAEPSDDIVAAAIQEEPSDPAPEADAPPPTPEQARAVAFGSGSDEILNAGTLRLEAIDDFDPLSFVATEEAPVAQAVLGSDAAAAPEPSYAESAVAEPVAVAAWLPAETEEGGAREEGRHEQSGAGEENRIEVAALSSAQPAGDAAGAQPDGASGDEPLWEEYAVECPRDWLSSSVPAPTASLTEDCEPKIVLVAPAELRGTGGTDADEPPLDEALENAAAAHAMELAGFVARLPRVRPDPPPVRRVRRTSRRADWPAAPPPDCGSLHAYWRFVDRRAGTKEWYCK